MSLLTDGEEEPPSVSQYFSPSISIFCGLLIPYAIAVWAILGFCQKRKKLFPGVLADRPGVVSPIHFVNPRHRYIYSLICAAFASNALALVAITYAITPVHNIWGSTIVGAILLILEVMVLAVIAYPMVACVEAPVPIVGYFLGGTYSSLYFTSILTLVGQILHAFSGNSDLRKIIFPPIIFTVLPQLCCVCATVCWYGYMFVKEIMYIKASPQPWLVAIHEQPPNNNNKNYVKALLKSAGGNMTWIDLYHKVSLPFPILLATGISGMVVLQLTILSSSVLVPLLNSAFSLDEKDGFDHIVDYLKAICVIDSFFASGMITALFFHLLIVIRKETILIRRGMSDFTDDIRKVTRPYMKLTSYTRYTGTQVASIITGWILYFLGFIIIGLLFGVLFFIPKTGGYLLYLVFISVLIVVSIIVIQNLMCYFFFLTVESREQWTILLDNRRAFNYFTYVGLLYSIASGLYSNVIRIMTAFVCTLLIMPRQDIVVLPSLFKSADSGYSAYKSFMIVEALLNNPVMHVFVDILVESRKRKVHNRLTYTEVKPSEGFRVSRRAKNRWLVAYTLLNNPSLRKNKYGYQYKDEEETRERQQSLSNDNGVTLSVAT